MGTFVSKSFGYRMLGLFAPAMLLASMSTTVFAGMQVVYIDGKTKDVGTHAPQVFPSTDEDGTAKVIRANTRVDEQKPAEEFVQSEPVAAAPAPAPIKKALPAPAAFKAPVAVAAEAAAPSAEAIELAQIKRQNAELQKRLEVLEQAKVAQKVEAKAEAQATLAPAPIVPQDAPDSQDIAPGAAAQSEAKTEDVVDSDLSPSDQLNARVKEKAQVSKAAKAELAQAQTTEQKQKALRERTTKFDQVPEQRISDVAQRLKYTNEILKRFGRAYDYRLMTLAEFQKTLNELDQAQEKTKSSN